MKIFALETNLEKLKSRFLSADEHEILFVRFHPFLFILRLVGQLLITAVLVAIGVWLVSFGFPWEWVAGTLVVIWFFLCFIPIFKAYIDWQYDFLMVTNEKVVIVNQTSVTHADINQLQIENFATVNTSTQFFNIFPFGKVCFDLKEGTGTRFCLKYIPDAVRVAAEISDSIEGFHRARRFDGGHRHWERPPSTPS